MLYRYEYGLPAETGAVVHSLPLSSGAPAFGTVLSEEPFAWSFTLSPSDRIYGLGENMRGMNKRGFTYTSWCSDESHQTESSSSLYGAHNFMLVTGAETFGIFFDTASRITFDAGWTDSGVLSVTSGDTGIDVYIITAENGSGTAPVSIVRQFRGLIGRSYIPPRWGFGFQQSRWGYRNESDVRDIIDHFRKAHVPLDAVCLDIDYMTDYEDFTVDENKFPALKTFAADMKKDGVRFVPIIDAGVKAKDGYSVYDEGMKNGYFCTEENGRPFTAGVWPGRSRFPDFLDPEVRSWFGSKYRALTSLGIEGFWNDMNEPAMFYSDESLAEAFEKVKSYEGKNLDIDSFFGFSQATCSTFNRMDDYERFYNRTLMKDGTVRLLRHDKVHNLFGANMTRAAGEGLAEISPDRRMLLYSRASCIGAHRYGGIWTGDNRSWWGHLKQEVQMMCGLNMCGFLYTGADIGGFGSDSSEDLVLRWTAFGVFTPLMRNHSAAGSRRQEFFQFACTDAYRSIMNLRYALIPFLYSEFVKAAVSDSMYFRPLAFDYPEDVRAAGVEDELMLGESLLVAPVYEQNASGRYVYLPEDMIEVRWHNGRSEQHETAKGDHFIEVPCGDVVFFIKHGFRVPLCEAAECTDRIDTSHFTFLGDGTSYGLYEDDGFTRDVKLEGRIRTI
jgi:alpha-glucosidase